MTPKTAGQVTPDEALKQVLELCDTLGYVLGIVALTPKTQTPVPIVEYLPDGVTVQLALMRKPDNGASAALSPP